MDRKERDQERTKSEVRNGQPKHGENTDRAITHRAATVCGYDTRGDGNRRANQKSEEGEFGLIIEWRVAQSRMPRAREVVMDPT